MRVQFARRISTVHPIASLNPPENTMKSFSSSPLKLVALVLSLGITLTLADALSSGFAAQPVSAQCVFELPAVTVHGKRSGGDNAVLANVATGNAAASDASTQL
jgi:hypothetical protein